MAQAGHSLARMAKSMITEHPREGFPYRVVLPGSLCGVKNGAHLEDAISVLVWIWLVYLGI